MELHTAEEILEELLPPLEALETQSGAVLQFLKEKGIATDEQLAPFLEQARNASNVRWRAARLRINHLLAPAFETAEKRREIKSAESAPKTDSKAEVEPQRKPQQTIGQPDLGNKEVGNKQRVRVRPGAPHPKKPQPNRTGRPDEAHESPPWTVTEWRPW
jgi:hypothetical protein